MNSSISEVFFETAERFPNKTALLYKKEGVYFPITYEELSRNITIFNGSLQNFGIKKNDKVAILSENRPEWVIADLASIMMGAIVVPLHTTFSSEVIGKILNHSEVKIIIISNSNLLNKVLLNIEKLQYLEKIIFLGEVTDIQKEDFKGKIISWKELFLNFQHDLRQKEAPHQSNKRIVLNSDDCCTIIYTSGTTGEPKGVVLTHKNFLSNIAALQQVIPVKKDDTFLSFLPLSHVLERTGGYYMPLFFGATIAYAEHIKQLPNNLKETTPTILVAVPRIFDKFHDAIWDNINASPVWKKKLFHWALKQKIPTVRHKIADRLIFKKIRKQLGGRLRLAISGGASLNEQIARFFLKIGIPIFEGYGLTETSPVISLNNQKHIQFGTVGKIIPGVELKISEDKEVLVRGPNVFKGYFNNEKETALSFNGDGWFCTGDLGFMSSHGFLTIIGRKKEMMVLSNGKKAWPESIENLLNNDKYIAQSMVVGNGQKFVASLIVPDWPELTIYMKKNNMPSRSQEELLHDPVILDLFQKRIDEKINVTLSDHEKVKKIILLAQEFSQERGQLTPTLKLRRHIIANHYKKSIESLYD